MKQKEMAALLQVSKEQRGELKEVLDSLVHAGECLRLSFAVFSLFADVDLTLSLIHILSMHLQTH